MKNDPKLVPTVTGDSDDPRIVRKGFNVQGACNNKDCRGFKEPKHRVWVPLGYSDKFDMA